MWRVNTSFIREVQNQNLFLDILQCICSSLNSKISTLQEIKKLHNIPNIYYYYFLITRNFGEHAFTPKQSIFDESIFGFDAKCTNQEEVCCKQTLEPPTEKNCEDDPEFHCVPSQVIYLITIVIILASTLFKLFCIDLFFQNCHENVKGEKGLIEVKPITEGSLFDVRQIGGTRIELDNTKSTCKKDLDICCKKAPVTTPTTTTTTLSTSTTKTTTTTTVTTTVRAPPKCGKHHPDGLEIKAKHSSDGGEGQR